MQRLYPNYHLNLDQVLDETGVQHGSIKARFLLLRVYEENAVIYGKIKMADFVYWFDFVIVVALCVRTPSRSCGGRRVQGREFRSRVV